MLAAGVPAQTTSPASAEDMAPAGATTGIAGAAELSLEQVISKVFLAYGGKDALAKLGTNCMILGEQKTVTPEGVKSVRIRQIRKGDGLRVDIEDEGGWTSTVYDGLRAWRVIGKAVQDLSPDEVQLLSLEKLREPSVLCNFSDDHFKFKLLGPTVHRAIPCYAVEVARGNGEPTTIFIDQKNYLVTAVGYTGTDLVTKTKAQISVDYSEYRPSGGTLLPFKHSQYVNDQLAMELLIQNIDLSTINEDEVFRRPDKTGEVRLEKTVTVPFLYSHKEILVKARINDGEPQDFLFDTGSSQTVIDRRTAAENLLDRQAGFNMTGAGGMFSAPAVDLSKFTIGDVNLSGVQAVVLDLSAHERQLGKRIAGIIGTNVLSRFAITLDYGKNQVLLQDATLYRAPPQANILPFVDKKSPTVKAIINGKDEVTMLMDTGAAFNNLPAPVAKKYLHGQTVRYTEGFGADGKAVRLGNLQIDTVKAGSSIVRDVPFTYSVDADLKSPTAKGFLAGAKSGIFGNPFWQNFTVTVDFRMRQVILQPNAMLSSRQQLESLVTTGDNKLNIYRDYRAAETAYQSALNKVQFLGDPKQQARIWGRLGNLRRIMAKDLNRPEQARVAYEYFSKARDLAHKMEDREIEGRVLADWALLYMDNGQIPEARQALDGGMAYAAQDPQVMVDFAVYLNKMQMYGDMRAYIDKALFLEPSNWQALWYRLKLCEKFNDVAQTKDTLKEILKYYPWSKIARDKLTALTAPPGMVPPDASTPNRPAQTQPR
ncbi:MAG: aspartyl protease family protein [Candidatus Obscuribacterales bacterium]|nr:aspartyl protease family protein [Candidatus Obscuribacterales bacterium]